MNRLQLRPCTLLGWAYCNGECENCRTTGTTDIRALYDPVWIAEQYAPKFGKPVVDLVEVVRCKDCKHLHINEYGQWCEGGFVHELSPIENNDFCSRGERKEE